MAIAFLALIDFRYHMREMASARRRILFDLSTAVKQRKAIPEMASARRLVSSAAGSPKWSRREMASGRRIDLGIPNKLRYLSTSTHHENDYFRDVTDILSTPERDYLFRNNGQKVPVSSLRNKIVGLYICESVPGIPHPPRMEAIKKVYEEAKTLGYDLEIVQITFDFHAEHLGKDPTIQQVREDVNWFTLPPKDPSFRKIQSLFRSDEDEGYWAGDSLVLIHPPRAGAGIHFEFSGAEILQEWGIQGYPFTRPSLYKAEYELQKREATLQWFFPPGDCLLRRPRPGGDGFDLVDAVSQLSGKRVLVLFADHTKLYFGGRFVSMLKSEYQAQREGNVAEESRFEVVYVSTGIGMSPFDEFTKDMPWLVQPFPSLVDFYRLLKVFKPCPERPAVVAFNEQGELIAKEDGSSLNEINNPQFPFIDPDLEERIRLEVGKLCDSIH